MIRELRLFHFFLLFFSFSIYVQTQSDLTYVDVADVDTTLQEIVSDQQLSAYPGQDLIEGDTPLAQLGRDLFFDPILSGDKNISCATCHHPEFTMADGRVLPIGVSGYGLGESRYYQSVVTISSDAPHDTPREIPNPFIGEFVPRNSPTVINGALLTAQFWDGRVQNYATGETVHTPEDEVNELDLTDALVAQALFPITSMHEMAGVTFGKESPQVIRELLIQRLRNHDEYLVRFEAVFGTTEIEPVHVVEAIGAFERQFIFTESSWDDYIAGDMTALTTQQKRGALLFFGVLNPDVNCATCHSGDLLTDLNYYNLLVPQIGPGKGDGVSRREDFGRARVTLEDSDQYTFRTPSLRNVELTAPYFHSGAYQTLEDVVWHHADVWDRATNYDPVSSLPSAYYDSVLVFNSDKQGHSVAPQLADGLPLAEQDVTDIVAFLEALTDPAVSDLSHVIPSSVPSGLPLDPISQ